MKYANILTRIIVVFFIIEILIGDICRHGELIARINITHMTGFITMVFSILLFGYSFRIPSKKESFLVCAAGGLMAIGYFRSLFMHLPCVGSPLTGIIFDIAITLSIGANLCLIFYLKDK